MDILPKVTAPKNPTRIGYDFIGWNAELPETPSSFDNILREYMVSLVEQGKKNDEFIEKITKELAKDKNE